MNAQEIKTLAINSSQTYHRFLTDAGGGVEEVKVLSISQNKEKFKLTLNKKLFNLEAIEFWLSGRKINPDQIKIEVYDNDTNVLLIKPAPELQEQFSKIHSDEIKIISDLKFLVKRVEDWYQENGNKIKLPTATSLLQPPKTEDFLQDMEPSTDQKAGIEAIFNNPLSYIWGAPGTGKTQLVLAYSLIHYIRAGKQVAIFAATNNALEQILHGVFEMTEKAGIEDSKILRLGTPSSKFAQAHPDSCETMGVQQKIGEVENQIQIIKDVLEHGKVQRELVEIERESKSIFSELDELQGSKEEMLLAMKAVEKDMARGQLTLDKVQLQILELEKSVRAKKKTVLSFLYGLKKKLTKNTDVEIALKKEKIELQTKKNEAEVQENTVRGYKEKHDEFKALYDDESKANKLIGILKGVCANDEKAKQIVSDTSLQNYENTKSSLNTYLQERYDVLASTQMIAPEYGSLTIEELEEKLRSWEEQKGFLESETEDRIKDANVIALTLDCYIGRYKDKELPGQHYFLDEAGYASLIKALTLFRKNAPVTFLGDHMQLPPVCEMEIRDEVGKRGVFMWAQSALYAEWMFVKNREEAFLDYFKNEPFVFQKTKKVDLKHTYRFGSALADTLDEFVYQNGFVAQGKNRETEIYFIHAPIIRPAPEIQGYTAHHRENRFEVAKIMQIFDIFNEEYAILTPYKKQVSLLGSNLVEARKDQKIMTVHGSQGKEWDDVILSVVDTSVGKMWFTDSKNKKSRGKNVLNTAVSRAKKRLFIVCNYNFWITQEEQLLKGLLDVAKEVE